jgi:hypothetical protein
MFYWLNFGLVGAEASGLQAASTDLAVGGLLRSKRAAKFE